MDEIQYQPIKYQPVKTTKKPFIKNIKWVAIVIAVLLIASVFAFLSGRAAFRDRNISFKVETPQSVESGQEVEIKINVNNDNKVSLLNPKLTIFYPDDSIIFNEQGEQIESLVEEIKLEQIQAKGSQEFIKKVILIGERGDIKTTNFVFSYQPSNNKSVFEKKEKSAITISTTPLYLNLVVPPNALPGQKISGFFDYKNESEDDLYDLRIKMILPDGLTLNEIDPEPDTTNNIWNVESLEESKGERINFEGTILGNSGQTKTIAFVLQRKMGNDFVDFQRVESDISLSAPLLNLSALVNNEEGYVANFGDNLNYNIVFTNRSNSTLSGLTLKATLSDGVFDLTSIDTGDGYFNQSQKSIIWNASINEKLGTLGPGQSGQVNFSVKLKDSSATGKDLLAKVNLSIESITIPEGYDLDKISATQSISTKILSKVNFETNGYYSDPSWPINSGPVPPKVGKKTTYTIHWKIGSSSSDLTNVFVSSYVLPGVTWENKVKVNQGSILPVYNPVTGQIIWELPKIPAGAGTSFAKYEAIFQVSITPSINQAGESIDLVRESILSVNDAFTGQVIELQEVRVSTSSILDEDHQGNVEE